MLQAVPSSSELDDLVDTTGLISAGIERVVAGRPQLVRLTVAVLLAEGHLLLEDVPGVGKTTLAKALARSIDCSVGRIQFTPDLLPSDLTGVNIFRAQTHEFEFRPGPVFANIVIGDEINRASPKTQSALLECMQESQATVDGTLLRAPAAVPRHRDAEPGRDGGHLPAARGAARPLHGAAHASGTRTGLPSSRCSSGRRSPTRSPTSSP